MKTKNVNITTDEGKIVEAIAPKVLSVSRATDIPAFYCDWFFDRLEKGYCRWTNPYNGKDTYIAFTNVKFIVFWSKNPTPLIPFLTKLRCKGIKCYLQYTLNDYEQNSLEPGVPSLDLRIETFKVLSGELGKEGVIWRYDPLMLTDEISIENLIDRIKSIGNKIHNYTEKLVFSFADVSGYRKVIRNLNAKKVNYREWNEADMREFASQLSRLNYMRTWNLKLATCAEKIDLSDYGINHNKCVDDELIARMSWQNSGLMEHLGFEIKPIQTSLFGEYELNKEDINVDSYHIARKRKSLRDKGQRILCNCVGSKDIGQYNTCAHGCVYCYANTSPLQAQQNHQLHCNSILTDKIL